MPAACPDQDQPAAERVVESTHLVVAAPPEVVPVGLADDAGITVVDRYPVEPMFADADRVVTAAGFNAMRQLEPHRARHRFVPLPRRYDDQFERARRARSHPPD